LSFPLIGGGLAPIIATALLGYFGGTAGVSWPSG
jgi:hypothetical protein